LTLSPRNSIITARTPQASEYAQIVGCFLIYGDSMTDIQIEDKVENPQILLDISGEYIESIVDIVNKINFHHDREFKNKLIYALGGVITVDCPA
jgi:hypothetical protein